MLSTEIEGKVEREFILSKRKEIREKWEVDVNENLFMEEKKLR